MSGNTDGRRAYDAWWATAEGVPRHPDVTYDQDGAAWEAAAAAGAAAARERVAELVTEGNELRELLREILGEFIDFRTATGGCHLASVNREQIAKWRKLAGLES